MNLVQDLRSAGVEWEISPVLTSVPSIRYPGKENLMARTLVRLTYPQGDMEVTVEGDFYPNSNTPLEQLLAAAMYKLLPHNPVLLKWQQSRGHGEVRLKEELLGEPFGECLQTALRKACVSEQSYIQWNTIHHLASDDWSHFLRLCREELRVLLTDAAMGKSKLTRVTVGHAFKRAAVDRMQEIGRRTDERTGRRVERTDLEKLALLCLEMANRLTEDQEFVWGWAAYLCEDLEASVSQVSQPDQPLAA